MAKSLWDKFMESLTEEEKDIWERWEEATQETPDELSKDERLAAASGGITSEDMKVLDRLRERWEELMWKDLEDED